MFYSILDEKQRRLYAGLESLKIGHGGDSLISQLLKTNPETVSKGRKELEQLLKYDTAGYPITGIKWTKTTTGKIAEELENEGIFVSADTIGKLLKDMGYSLKIKEQYGVRTLKK